jgi:hypothetical protein
MHRLSLELFVPPKIFSICVALIIFQDEGLVIELTQVGMCNSEVVQIAS